MALDPQQLKILTTSGTPDEMKFSKSVLPVRIHGNFLLCTLLLGNVLGKKLAISKQ
jgi:metal transporter CNNM